MLHEHGDGTFSISSRGAWLPGTYADKAAAWWAFRFDDQTLQGLAERVCHVSGEGRAITTDDLCAARAEGKKGTDMRDTGAAGHAAGIEALPEPGLLDGVAGERLELPVYYADFQRNFRSTREFWKLERGQAFAEPGNASWEAFSRGAWAQSMRLIEDLREDLKAYHRETSAAGTSTRRVRVVSFPLAPYMQWELHVLRLRDEVGGPVRVLPAADVAGLEDRGPLPEVYTMDRDVMYQAVYDGHGVLEHALRYTEAAVVSRCRDLIAGLYDRAEPVSVFFEREVAHLPPPAAPFAIPGDYLEQTGRPRPIRS